MDLDGDGHMDILSGSYSPGYIYFFRGKADGSFEKGEPLKDAEGKNLTAGGSEESTGPRAMESLAASPFACDYFGRGVLDLLVGNIEGHVILIPNEGTATHPVFNPKKRRMLEAEGQPIKVPGGDAGPCVADWDMDGKPDLLVGAGDGSVWFFRNIGTRTEPRYARGVMLISASTQNYSNPVAAGAAPERPGMRTKICVVDWNGDGLPDLLVGDCWYQAPALTTLTPKDIERRDQLKARQIELMNSYGEVFRKLKEEPEQNKELKKLGEELSSVARELAPLIGRNTVHGSVWLYLRKPGATQGR